MIPQEDPYDTIRRLSNRIDELAVELDYERTYVTFLRAKGHKKRLAKKLKKLEKKLPSSWPGSL